MDHHSRDKRQEEVCPSSRDIPAAGDIGALQGGHPIHPADRHHHTGKEEEEDSSVGRSVGRSGLKSRFLSHNQQHPEYPSVLALLLCYPEDEMRLPREFDRLIR